MADTDACKPLVCAPNTAARLLDCSRSKIYALMKAGTLTYIQIGADRRIPIKEIERIATEGLQK